MRQGHRPAGWRNIISPHPFTVFLILCQAVPILVRVLKSLLRKMIMVFTQSHRPEFLVET